MTICFIGGGNMARALITGLISDGTPAKDITVVELDASKREHLQQEFGINTSDQLDAAEASEVVVLAVKPQQLRNVAIQLGRVLREQIVLSIAAGIRLTDLARWLGGIKGLTLVRAMPNTPAQVRAGVTALAALYSFPPQFLIPSEKKNKVESIMASVGSIVWVSDEKEMDAVTAVSGSGPAYMFYFLEAMQEAGCKLGLSPEQSRLLALQTMAGTAKLADNSVQDFATLRAQVTSKGGTTESALESMQEAGVKESIIKAMEAAATRSAELGDLLGKD